MRPIQVRPSARTRRLLDIIERMQIAGRWHRWGRTWDAVVDAAKEAEADDHGDAFDAYWIARKDAE